MRVGEIGEFALIERLHAALPKAVRQDTALEVGIGDDAAVWRSTSDEAVIITADSLVAGIHFRLDWTSWRSLGHKALAVNISDIAAMGGAPKVATVSLALTGHERVSDLEALYEGMGELAARYGTLIAGGDIVAAPHDFAIHVTLLGQARFGRVLTRAGAQPGDLIGVSGTIGASAAGLRLLGLPDNDPRRQATTADLLIAAHLEPQPRVELGRILNRNQASSAMDLSDGLFGDLPKILLASNVRATVEAGRLPVAAAIRALFRDEWLDLATRGGEDYELLFTASPSRMEAIIEDARDYDQAITVIGVILPPDDDAPLLTIVSEDGEERPVEPGAFDHFQ